MARKMNKRQSAEQLTIGAKVDCTALYIRVSTDKQAEEGFSLEAQKEKLFAYATAQGWNVCTNHIYVDAGVSGKTTDRPAYQRMIAAAHNGDIQRIATTKLDRLSRNTSDFLQLVEDMERVGCALAILDLNIDTGTPTGKLVATVLAGIAEWERKQINERVMSGKTQKAQEGGYNGAQCPLGYKYDNGAFAVDSSAAYWVREVFSRFVSGQAMSKIAADLNDAGATTAKGGKWYAGTVRYILQNGFYAGLSQWDGCEVEGNHPAIISRGLYEYAHQRLKSIKPGPVAA
jgi:site-specific DNA recombinase